MRGQPQAPASQQSGWHSSPQKTSLRCRQLWPHFTACRFTAKSLFFAPATAVTAPSTLDHPPLVVNCEPCNQRGQEGARGQRHKAGPQEQHQKPLSSLISIRKTPAATGHLPKTCRAFAKRSFSQTGISWTMSPQDPRTVQFCLVTGRVTLGHYVRAGRQRSVGDLLKFRVGDTHSLLDKCVFLSLIKGYCKNSNKNVFVSNN